MVAVVCARCFDLPGRARPDTRLVMRGKKRPGQMSAEEDLREKAQTMFDRVDEDRSGFLDVDEVPLTLYFHQLEL